MASNTPAKIVATFFEALSQGDVATARDCWSENAIWHATGRADLAGDYEPEAYFAMLGEWAARYPEYDFTLTEVGEFDDTAVFFIESTNGMAPGRASGLTVYRMTAGKIAEGWAIPASGDSQYLFLARAPNCRSARPRSGDIANAGVSERDDPRMGHSEGNPRFGC